MDIAHVDGCINKIEPCDHLCWCNAITIKCHDLNQSQCKFATIDYLDQVLWSIISIIVAINYVDSFVLSIILIRLFDSLDYTLSIFLNHFNWTPQLIVKMDYFNSFLQSNISIHCAIYVLIKQSLSPLILSIVSVMVFIIVQLNCPSAQAWLQSNSSWYWQHDDHWRGQRGGREESLGGSYRRERALWWRMLLLGLATFYKKMKEWVSSRPFGFNIFSRSIVCQWKSCFDYLSNFQVPIIQVMFMAIKALMEPTTYVWWQTIIALMMPTAFVMISVTRRVQ